MLYIMDKNEVITLSSDDENDFTHCPENNVKSPTKIQLGPKVLKVFKEKCQQMKKNGVGNKRIKKIDVVKLSEVPKKKCKMACKVFPEVVDLEDCPEKTNQTLLTVRSVSASESTENHSKLDVIDIDDVNENNASLNKELSLKTADDSKTSTDLLVNTVHSNEEIISNNITETAENSRKGTPKETSKKIDNEVNENLKFFTEFVEYCGSLEEIPNDKTRLMKKLMKRYGEADENYTKSQDFVNLIKKCREKVQVNNLYLMAKEITDELSFRKGINIGAEKSVRVEVKSRENEEALLNNDVVEIKKKTLRKKRTKYINKVIKNLNKLGKKIRDLEEQEVDLSDEEESVYVRLQRYRERFCQIHAKLCKFTDEIPDAERCNNRKICFTESRYPAINKCIENWLNKTKRFPDFSDIMKLLESQSSSLNLPSNKESIRAIAIEIFQQVGAMLQRRRRYDLWDSCCGFLNDVGDPAISDPALETVLKANFENRIKKENEIFQHFVELQEKERLEPEEVPDEEASHSPADSGNEDEKELEEIENSMNKKLDIAIKNIQEDDDTKGNSHSNENKNDLESTPSKSKESKNDYKNCKSLKWRSGSSEKSNLENSNPEKQNGVKDDSETESDEDKSDSDLELIAIKDVPVGVKSLKRELSADEEICRKKMSIAEEGKSENIEKSRVFDVQRCQIFTDGFDCLSKERRNWRKRRVFRDLTNVKRLLEANGKKRKMSEFFSPFFFQRSFCEYEKSSWKNRFKVSFRLVTPKDQKCALNQDEKSEKTLNSESGKDEENAQDGADKTGNEEGEFPSSHGNGSEEDNNEDENKKNGKTDLDESQPEEDDEEEIETEEDNADSEAIDHSNEKTERHTDVTYSESKNNLVEDKENAEVSENTNEETDEELVEKEVDESKKESSRAEGMDVTESLGEDQTSEVESETRESMEDKFSKSEDNNSKTEVRDFKFIEDQFEEHKTAKEDGEKEIHNTTEDIETEEENTTEEDIEKEHNTTVEDIEMEEQNTTGEETEKEENNTTVEDIEKEHNTTVEDIEMEEQNTTGEKTEKEENNTKVGDIEKEEHNTTVEDREKYENNTTEEDIEKEHNTTVEDIEMEEHNTTGEKIEKEEHNTTEEDIEKKEQNTTVEDAEKEKNNTTIQDIEKEEHNTITRDAENVKPNTTVTSNQNLLNADTENEKIRTRVVKNCYKSERNVNSVVERGRKITLPVSHRNEKANVETIKRETIELKPSTIRKLLKVEPSSQKVNKKSTSASDEERVKRFLLHSPSSISITPPRKLSLTKPPSQAALQALATLRNLKGISATIVRGGKPRSEDDVVVIGGSSRRNESPTGNPAKRPRQELPVISSVQSIDCTTPKIVTVQGNVSGFDNSWPDVSSPQFNTSSIRISNVWGSLPESFMPSAQNTEAVTPGCSSRQANVRPSKVVKKKTAKKPVEYVVLE